MPKTAECRLESIAGSPYSQSGYIDPVLVPKKPRENPRDYEERTWRERCTVGADGETLLIPPMAFANNLKTASAYLGLKIPGRGSASYTKHFQAGVLVIEGVPLKEKKAAVEGEWLFVPSDGKPGGGKRVSKCFPKIPHWSGTVTYHIVDDTITEDIFRQVLAYAGNVIGIGRFRPEHRGFYGRFRVVTVKWQES